ncbi:MAG TPA: NAD-dependent epimerase/dehydratase family protein, partial [Gemmatimonadaceae bacterium]|nr:NAD-dependent epimerase/dehydratase family protein [Gemmatimonadaceae bacterium]
EPEPATDTPDEPRRAAPLRILILGGTGFIGPNQVQYALDRGHKVTLFNRGVTNTSLFPNVPRLVGDRNLPDGHKALESGEWDVVIDNPTSNPKWVRDAGRALKGRTKHYMFVSTISVFSDTSAPFDENGTLHAPSDIDAPYDAKVYGQNKVRSEMEAKAQFGDAVTIVRPGLIVGPGDLSDRFSYWPVRIDRGGEVLAPGTPNDPVQYVDARDLSEFIVRLAESKTTGIFNATGPKAPTTIAEMLHGIKAVTTSDAQFTWVPAEFLTANQVRAWSDMPVWVPPMGRTAAFARVNCSKAYAAGLTFRPLAETAAATLAWYKTRPAAEQEKARAGLAPDREKTVLAAWHSARASR